MKRPAVGSEPHEQAPGEWQLSNRVPGSERVNTTPVRIEIAKSGDLAYEFSNGELSFELKNGKKESLTNSSLRVWRKEAGVWKMAAQFTHPHYQDPTAKP